MTFINKLKALKIYFTSCLLLVIVFSVEAQTPVTLSIDTVSGNNGTQVTVSVRVHDFQDIISVQGSINFNSAVATYSNITYFGLPGMNIGSFGLTQIGSGKISFSWMDGSLTPRSLGNNAILFSIQFNITGSGGQQTSVNLTGDPLAIEFINGSLQTLTVNSTNGRIRVANASTPSGISLLMKNVSGNSGSQIILPVRAVHFKNMISAQGSIHFTPSVVSFVSVEQIDIPGMSASDFGTSQTGSGVLTFSWIDGTLSGASLADTSTLFAIRFNLAGTSGQQSSVDFSNTPAAMEFIDTSNNSLALSTTNGNISISSTPTDNLELRLDTVYGAEGAQVIVSCRVRNFSDVLSLQGSLSFNPLIAAFAGIEQYGLPDLNASSFGTTQTSSGILTYLWFNSSLTGVTLPDDSAIFKIRFNLVGTPGGTSSVSFVNSPTSLEAANSIPLIISTDYQGGQINISNITSITTGIISPVSLCSGQSLAVPYTKTGIFNSGNIFTAQLSAPDGSFASPVSIGALSGVTNGTIAAVIPHPITQGTAYRIRVVSSNTVVTGSDNGVDLSLFNTPLMAGTPTGNSSLCVNPSNSSYSTTGAAYASSYAWFLSPSGAGVISGTSTTATVDWNNTYTGSAQITVKGLNSSCEGPMSPILTVNISSGTVGGNVNGGTTPICLGSSTGILTLSGQTGTVQRWQKMLNGGSWSDIANTNATYSETPSSAGTWRYKAIVKNGACDTTSSGSVSIVVSAGTIGGSVTGGSSPICLGSSTGTLTLSGQTGTVQRWQKMLNGGSWSNIANTNTTYSEIPSSAGTWRYKAIVKNGVCDTTSSGSVSIVVNAVTVGGSVTGGTSPVCFGSSTGTMTISGHTGTVQRWQKMLNGGSWSDIVNTNTTYSETPSSAGTWRYKAIVKNGACDTASSGSVSIIVNSLTTGGVATGGSTPICLGSSTGTLNLNGQTGSVLKWQKMLNGSFWTDIVNTSVTYSEIPSSVGTWRYKAIVKNGACDTASSASVSIVVNAGTVGGVITGGASPICLGSSTGIMTLNGYTGTIQKWQKMLNGGSWSDIANTNTTYSEIPSFAGTWRYKAIIKNGVCDTGSSVSVSIVVNAVTVGGSVTGGTSPVCLGSSTGTMTLSGHTGTVLKWQKMLNGSFWTDIINSNVTYSEIPSSVGTWRYKAIVKNGACDTASSASVSIVVNAGTVGGNLTGGTSPVCLGSSTGTMTLGGFSGMVQRWQKMLNGGSWSDIANTNTTYSEIPSSAGTWRFKAIVKNGVCDTASSGSISIVVNALTVGGSVTGGMSPVCLGSSTGTMTLNGHTGTVQKWQKMLNGGSWSDIANTNATYSETPSSAGTWRYKAIVKNGACDTASSLSVSIVVNAGTAGGSVTGGSTPICLGSSTGAMNLSGYTGTIQKWQKMLNGSFWTDIVNTNSTYSEIPSSAGTWRYKAIVKNGVCDTVSSASISIVVNAVTVGGSVTGGTSPVCLGSSTGTMTISGHTGTVQRWQKMLNGGSWSDIVNTNTTYSETPSSAGTWRYKAIVKNGACDTASSGSVSIIVNSLTTGGVVTGGSTPICLGSSTGALNLNGQTGSVLKWQKMLNGSFWTDIVNTNVTYSEIPSSAGTWRYKAIVKNGACDTASSASVSIVVNAGTVGGSLTGGASPICLGFSTGTMTLSGYTGTIQKWQKMLNGGSWSDIANTNTTYSEIPSSAGTWRYKAIVKNGVCDTASSGSVSIVVNALTVGGSLTGGTSPVCLGSSTGTMTLISHTGTVQKWQKMLNGSFWTDIVNTNATYSEYPSSVGTWRYKAIIKNGACDTASSGSISIIVNPGTFGGSISGGNTPVCLGSSTGIMTLSGHSGTVQKWQKRINNGAWSDITNTGTSYSEIALTAGTWSYKAIVRNGVCDTASSFSVSIEVDALTVGGTLTGGTSPVCLGSSTGTMTLSGHTGNVQKWQKMLNGSFWTDINDTGTTYSEIPSTEGTWRYKAIVKSGSCDTTSSLSVSIIVNTGTVGGNVTGGSSPICLGSSTGMMTLNSYTGVVQKWQKRLDNGSWIDITSSASTYAETPSTAGTWDYRAEVQNGICPSAYSAAQTIVVDQASAGGSVTGTSGICLGGSTGSLTLTGNTGTVVKWQKRLNGGGWTDINNTGAAYSEIPAAEGTWEYRAEVQSGVCISDFSVSAAVVVSSLSAGGNVSGSTQICLGDSTGVLTASGYNGNILYWQKRLNAGVWTIMNITSPAYSEIPSSSGTWCYRVSVQNGTCLADYSDSAVVVVNDVPPTPVITQSHDTLFSSSLTGNQWYNSGGLISNASSTTFHPPADDDYFVIVTINGCSSEQSNTINFSRVNVGENPDVCPYVIYPNPFTDILYLSFSKKDTKYDELTLYNTSGQLVYTVETSYSTTRMNLGFLPKGVYFLKIAGENKGIVMKIVKL